ncbi:MAG TPA: IS110 family transposase [Anaerolineae bacterium]|nr:IS110 family transposase [Anaerolineae bacterium]
MQRKEIKMRILGIDLAVVAKHRAILADERGRFISGILKFRTTLADLERIYATARRGMAADEELVVVLEATDIVWYPVAIYFHQRGATVYLVNPRMAADLARFYKRHAKSDRLSARTLARLLVVNPDGLYPWVWSGPDYLALQRGCKELERLIEQASAIQNRLRSIDHLGWPDLHRRVFAAPFSQAARWFRDHFYDPRRVVEAGASGLRQDWRAAEVYDGDEDWIEPLLTLAQEVLSLYGEQGDYLDYRALADEVQRGQRRLAALEADARFVRLQVTRPRYRQLHPSRNLETIKGVGQDGAAVHVGFIGDPSRFATNRAFRGWSGLVPYSSQSGEREGKGLRITQAGPDPVKKYAFLEAESARQWDPQIAAIYHDQMMNKGKHHTQAVCACATHLLDRIRVILSEDRPYELRDVDGTPVTPQQARAIIAERYTVPEEVRRRNTRRARRERAERRAERKEERRSRSR